MHIVVSADADATTIVNITRIVVGVDVRRAPPAGTRDKVDDVDEVNLTTWVYIPRIVGSTRVRRVKVYFNLSKVYSRRNLDLHC